MSDKWAKMLGEYGLGVDTKDTVTLGQVRSVSDNNTQLVDLAGYAIIDVTGEDASAFLQGQFCNDLADVSLTRAQITGYCTPKGRLLALPIIVGYDTGYRLLLPAALAEGFIKRLSLFVMRSKVSINQRTDWVCTGVIAGLDGTLGQIGESLGTLPLEVLNAVSSETQQVIRWHDDVSTACAARYWVLASVDDQISAWQAGKDCLKLGSDAWRLGDISAGIPSIVGGNVEAFIPQMINLQLINGLSFTKGCYPGQEIVARMQYLGKLKRHMRLFHLPLKGLESVPTINPGDSLNTLDDAAAGIVVDAVQLGGEFIALLSVVKVSANQATLRFSDFPLESLSAPYELPSLTTSQANAS